MLDIGGFFIFVCGRSFFFYCYFELEELDYVFGGRRNFELRGFGGVFFGFILDFIMKVIEFKLCGVKVKNIK